MVNEENWENHEIYVLGQYETTFPFYFRDLLSSPQPTSNKLPQLFVMDFPVKSLMDLEFPVLLLPKLPSPVELSHHKDQPHKVPHKNPKDHHNKSKTLDVLPHNHKVHHHNNNHNNNSHNLLNNPLWELVSKNDFAWKRMCFDSKF